MGWRGTVIEVAEGRWGRGEQALRWQRGDGVEGNRHGGGRGEMG